MLRFPRELEDEIYLRPRKLKIFVSSRMSGGVLRQERLAVAEAVESTTFAEAWYWERDAAAGPVCAEAVCLGHARTSDALILLIGQDLTEMTRREYEAALNAAVPCMVFLADDVERDIDAKKFVATVREDSSTTSFANLSELRTQVTNSLSDFANRAVRIQNYRRRDSRRARIPIVTSYDGVPE